METSKRLTANAVGLFAFFLPFFLTLTLYEDQNYNSTTTKSRQAHISICFVALKVYGELNLLDTYEVCQSYVKVMSEYLKRGAIGEQKGSKTNRM